MSFVKALGSEAHSLMALYYVLSLGLLTLGMQLLATSGNITVLMTYGRSGYTEMFGDVTFHFVLHNTTPMTKPAHMHVKKPTATMSGPRLMPLSP